MRGTKTTVKTHAAYFFRITLVAERIPKLHDEAKSNPVSINKLSDLGNGSATDRLEKDGVDSDARPLGQGCAGRGGRAFRAGTEAQRTP